MDLSRLAPPGKKWGVTKYGQPVLVDAKPGKSSNPFGTLKNRPDPYTAWLMNVKSSVEAKKPDRRRVDWHDEYAIEKWEKEETAYQKELAKKKRESKSALLNGQSLFLEAYDPNTHTIIKTRNPAVTKEMLRDMPKHYWSKIELQKVLPGKKISNAVSMEIHALGPEAGTSFASWFLANYPLIETVKKEHVLLWLRDLPNTNERFRKRMASVEELRQEKPKKQRVYSTEEGLMIAKRKSELEKIKKRVAAEMKGLQTMKLATIASAPKDLKEMERRARLQKKKEDDERIAYRQQHGKEMEVEGSG